MLDFGFRAHDFGSFDSADELGKTISKVQTPSHIQLALGKVIKNTRPWNSWDEEYISSISSTLLSYGIRTSVIGCYINPVNPDPELRKKEIERFKTSLRLSKAFGTNIVGTETGSFTPDNSYSVKTSSEQVLSIFYKSLDEMLNCAIKEDAICAIEPVNKQHTICSIERAMAMIEKFDDPHLKIILDPINLLPWTGLIEEDGSVLERPSEKAMKEYTNSCLSLLSKHIVAIHIKDFILDKNGYKIGTIPAPKGVFNWSILLNKLRELKLEVPILLENLNPRTIEQDLALLRQL